MKMLDKYIKELTEKVKINEKALLISERGASMEEEPHMGFYLPFFRADSNDAIIGTETIDEEDRSSTVVFWWITSDGFEVLTGDDPKFSEKINNISDELMYKKVYGYRITNFGHHEVVDLRSIIQSRGIDIYPHDIPISWDPLPHGEITESWKNGQRDKVMIHAIAQAYRIYVIYLASKLTMALEAQGNIKPDIHVRRRRPSLIKLPTLKNP